MTVFETEHICYSQYSYIELVLFSKLGQSILEILKSPGDKNSTGPLVSTRHVEWIAGSANRTLGFVRCNIKTKMSKVSEMAYNTLVRPQLEYASAVWDHRLKQGLPKVQRRASAITLGRQVQLRSFKT